MKKLTVIISILLSIFILTGCDAIKEMINPSPINISVMAVSTLREPLEKIKSDFESKENITLNLTFSSSSEITDKIKKGEQTDLIILSSQKDMDSLANESLIDTNSRIILVSNTLVAVVSAASDITSLEGLESWQTSQIVVGNPDATTSGRYVQNTIASMDLTSSLGYKVIYENSTESILKILAENTDYAGIIFKSDAVNNNQLRIVYEFPVESYDTINYPMALAAELENPEECETFKEYLQSGEAQNVFSTYGFNAVAPPPAPTPAETTEAAQ